MTTIVWDGEHIYTDSQFTESEMKSLGEKAWRIVTPDGPVVAALCGEFHREPAIRRALADGEPVEGLVGPDSSLLVVGRTEARQYADGKSWPVSAPVFLGSGSGPAQGAYYVAKHASVAIKAAIALDLYSSGPVRRLRAKVGR